MSTFSLRRPLFAACAALLLLLMMGAAPAWAQQVPEVITYQGTLADADGNPVADPVDLTFRFFDAESDGAPLPGGEGWSESYTGVPVTNGRFSVPLGSQTPLPDGLFDNRQQLWLEVAVNGETLPRTRMTSTAFAREAQSVVDGAIGAGALQDGAVTQSKLADETAVRRLQAQASDDTPVGDALTDDVAIKEGDNVTLTVTDNVLTISAVAPDGGLSSVAVETPLTGDGTSGNPIGIGGISNTELADNAVTSAKIQDGQVGADDLAADAVTTANLAGQAVTTAKLAPSAVDSTRITDGTIGTAELEEEAVTGAKIEDGTVSASDLGAGVVGASQLATDAVATASIQDNAVTSAKLDAGAAVRSLSELTGDLVLTAEGGATLTSSSSDPTNPDTLIINAGSGGGGTGIQGIQTETQTAIGIQDPNGPTATINLKDAGVTSNKIASSAVTADKIATSAAVKELNNLAGDVDLIGGTNIDITPNSGTNTLTISAGQVGDITSVSSGTGLSGGGSSGDVTLNIASAGVNTTQLADDAVTSSKLRNSSVTGDKIVDGTIGAADIGAGAVQEAQIASSAVTANKIASGAVTGGKIAPGATVTGVNGVTDDVRLAPGGIVSITESGSTVTISASETGDIESVSGIGGLTGGATTGDAQLSIADGGVTAVKLGTPAAPSANEVLSYDGSGLVWTAATSGGITSVNTDGTLTGDGNTTALGIADGGVDTPQLAAGAVTSSEVADGSVAPVDVDGSGGTSGQVLITDGTAVSWGNPSAVVQTDGTTITGDGAGTALSVGTIGSGEIADGSVSAGDLSTNAAIQTISDGTNSVTGTGTVAFEGTNGIAITADNTANTVTFDGSSLGGLTSVSSDATLTGDGTTGAPLGLAGDAVGTGNVVDNSLTADDLAAGAVTSSEVADGSVAPVDVDGSGGTSGQVLITDGTAVSWGNPSAVVQTDGTTITGDGAGTALSVGTIGSGEITDGSVAPADLSSATAGANQALVFDGTSVIWSTPAVNADGTTIAGDGAGSALSIPVGGVTTNEILDGTVASDDLGSDAAVLSITAASGTGTALSGGITVQGTGGITVSDDGASTITIDGTTLSSIRWKENVRTLESPVELVEQLRGVRYDWTESGEADVGVIAEEVAEVLPELVAFEEDGQARGVHYGKLVSVLIEATKVQQSEIEAKTQTIEGQRDEIEALKDRMDRLERLVEQQMAGRPSEAASSSSGDRQ